MQSQGHSYVASESFGLYFSFGRELLALAAETQRGRKDIRRKYATLRPPSPCLFYNKYKSKEGGIYLHE